MRTAAGATAAASIGSRHGTRDPIRHVQTDRTEQNGGSRRTTALSAGRADNMKGRERGIRWTAGRAGDLRGGRARDEMDSREGWRSERREGEG